MMYINILILLVMSVFCVTLSAQETALKSYILKGVLLDSISHSPEPYITAYIYRSQYPSNSIKFVVTNANGEFNVPLPSEGNYIIEFKGMGIKTLRKEFILKRSQPIVDMGPVYVIEDVHELNGVTVVSRRKLIKMDIDKLEYNVEADPTAAVSSTFDMLKKVPFVTINGQDQVKINGNGNFRVYVNGHATLTVNARNLADVLRGMPANTIKSIQVITNPDAKYDAEGVSGILNIVKRKVQPGYMVSLSGTASNTSLYGRIFSTLQTGKFTFAGNASYIHGFPVRSYGDDEYINNSSIDRYRQTTHREDKRLSSGSTTDNLSVSYEIDSLRLLTVSVGVMASRDPNDTKTGVQMFSRSSSPTFAYDEHIHRHSNMQMVAVQSNYQRLFQRKGEMLNLGYQYSAVPHQNKTYTDYSNLTNYTIASSSIYRKEIPQTAEHTFQMDYTYPINDKQTLETGAKYIRRLHTNNYHYYKGGAIGEYSEDVSKFLDYNETDNIYAVYGEYSLREEKWSLKGGIRYEYTHQHLQQAGSNTDRFKSHYGDIVPSASFFHKIGESQSLRFSYAMRISRPSISCLNPRVIDDDPLNIYYGNPLLNSEKSHSLNVEYGYTGDKVSLQVSLGHRFVNNSIESYTFIQGDVLNNTYRNIGRNSDSWLSLYLQNDFSRKLHGSLNANATYIYYRDVQNDISKKGLNYSASYNVEYSLPWQITFNGDVQWNSRTVTPQARMSAIVSYNVSLQRTFFDRKLTVSVSASDFMTRYRRSWTRYDQPGYYYYNTSHDMARHFGISFNYRFGKMKKAVPMMHHTIYNTDLKVVK